MAQIASETEKREKKCKMCNRDMEDFLYLRTRYDKEQYLSRLETAL